MSRLRAALERLNPALPPEAITAAVDELTRDRSAMSLEAANREVYRLLKEGIPVFVMDAGDSTPHPGPLLVRGGEGVRSGGQKTERVRVIDWEQPENDDFLLVSQFSVTGLPLVVIELKKPGVPARAAFDENLTHCKQQIPVLFWFDALLIASNGTDIPLPIIPQRRPVAPPIRTTPDTSGLKPLASQPCADLRVAVPDAWRPLSSTLGRALAFATWRTAGALVVGNSGRSCGSEHKLTNKQASKLAYQQALLRQTKQAC